MSWLEKFEKIIWIGLIIFGVMSRFIWLDKFPSGMSHDEIEYIMSARNYWQNGSDLSGVRFPESIFRTKTEGIISFLPAVLMAPIYGNIDWSQAGVRLPYVIINLLTALGMYLWVKEMFKNQKLGMITSVVFLFSPWSFYFSRMASDTAWALMFSVWAGWQLTKQKNKNLVISFLLFGLAFFSYHGAKVVLPLVVIWGATFYQNKKTWLMAGGFLIVTLGYFGALKLLPDSIYGSRKSDIVFLDKELLKNKVDDQRKLTIESKLTPIFENKIIAGSEIFIKNYLTAFSPEVLFLEGDKRATYKFGAYGLVHLIEVIFIFGGLGFLFKSNHRYRWWIVGLGLIAPVATGLSLVETSVINRSFLLLPVLIILIGLGIENTDKKIKIVGVVGLLISFGGFLFFYFFRWTRVNQESYFLSERVAANYIKRNIEREMVVVSLKPREIKLETEFYGGENKNIEYSNVCPKTFDKNKTYVIERAMDCQIKEYLAIAEEEFWGPLIYIINDKLCSNEKLEPWVNRKNSDYAIETMNNIYFCQRWIRK